MKTPHMYSFALNRAQADASPLARASRRLALFAFAVLLASHSAQGATNRFSTGTSWNVPSDWSLGTTPTSGDALLFSTVAPATTTLDNSFTADTLSFNTPNTMAIDANASGTTAQTLTLNNTTTDANGFNDVISLLGGGTINFGVTASKGVLTLALTASTNNIDVANSSSLVFGSNSTIAGASSAVSFNGNTSGRLTLNAANTFSGFTLTSGRVTALNTTALGVSTGILTLNGGTLDLRGTPNTTIAENYNTVVGGNAIIETGVTSAGVASTHTLGTLSIGAATLTVNKGANVTSGRPRVSFGNTTLTGSATFDTGGNATLLLGNAANATVPTGNFNMSFQSADGTGASIIRGAGNSARSSGTTTLTSGLLSFNANANAQPLGTVNSSNVLVLNGGLLALQMSTQIGAYNTTVGGNTQILVDSNNALTVGFTQTFGTLSIASNTLTVSGLNGSAAAYGLAVVATSGTTGAAFGATTLAGNPIFNVTNTANAGTAVSRLNLGALNDGGTARTITKTGDATLALTANATSLVNGTQLNISAGNVSVNATTALGTLAAVDVADGATFTLGANQTIGALTNTSTTSNTGSVVLGSNTLTVGSTNNLASSFSGTISGGGALTKGGSNTFTLSGSNSYTGTTTVNAGSLAITSGGSLASGNALTVGASGTANFANAGQTLGAVSNANTATNALNFSAATGTVTLASLSGAGNTRFGSNGTVTGGISTGTVNAVGLLTSDISGGTVGAGSLTGSTVSGGTNTITGAAGITTLSNGTTTVGGAATIGTMSGGTAYLNGTSAITNLNGGTVNLGSTVLSVAGGTTSGTIAGSGGSINKIGGTTLTLSGNNSHGNSERQKLKQSCARNMKRFIKPIKQIV